MRQILGTITALAIGLPAMAAAESGLVVVELFTSQGCSSCPPADELLAEMAKNPEILPLAFHVDYWDYLGWRDSLGGAAHTARQKAYAHAAGERMIYTPQAIVNGVDRAVGSDAQALMSAIMHQMNQPEQAKVTLALSQGNLIISGTAVTPLGKPVEVLLVRYRPQVEVEILHGENAGHTITYVNTVTSLTSVGQWSGAEPLSITTPISGSEAAAVLLQQSDMGALIAAAVAP